jgi:hypothetical protein
MSTNECCIKVMGSVFEDQENSLLYVKDVIKLDQVVMISLLKEFDFSQSKKWYTISILKVCCE